MQTFAEWLDSQLLERGWSAADLTLASRTPEDPRGIDSGLISRWRRKDALAVVPTTAKTLARLARALGVPDTEVAHAAGLVRTPTDPRAQIEAKRQVVRDQLFAWLDAVGTENESFFWDYLKTHGESGVELVRQVRTAVNADSHDAVNDAVSDRPKRGPRSRRTGNGPLRRRQHRASEVLDVGKRRLVLHEQELAA